MEENSGVCRNLFFISAGMITTHQIKRLVLEHNRTGNMSKSALKAGLSRKTARKYLNLSDPFDPERKVRTWRTRADPFAEIWAEVQEMLRQAPGLEAGSLFEYLQGRYPDRFLEGQLRTFQRQVKQWRQLHGPEREVFFDQVHVPGRVLQTDWTHLSALGVTIRGEPYRHLLCHSVLPYSNWEWATRCQSESLLSLRAGVQSALGRLGRVPREWQLDNSSAATHQLKWEGAERGFNPEFLLLAAHFGMEPRTIRVRCPQENGDVESENGHLKRRLRQLLLLRGSSDFSDENAYDEFLAQVLEAGNRRRAARVAEELAVMRELPGTMLPDYEEFEARVSNRSFLRIKKVSYSVPAQLIGSKVRVRVSEKEAQVYAGGQIVCTMPRSPGGGSEVIDYRHIIGGLVRKPGAFGRYRYREALFPGAIWRELYDRWSGDLGRERGEKEYLHLLKMAAEQGQEEVEKALASLLAGGGKFGLEGVRRLLPALPGSGREIAVPVVDLKAYDELLERGWKEESDAD